jgi:hypothetical protein
MIKKIKNKYLLFSAFFIIFLFIGGGLVHALEVTYPSIPLPGLTPPSADCVGNTCLPKYITYLFGLLIYIAGILALISFTIGAIELINPNIEAHKDAKDRMIGSILGLVLTLASFFIIQTINPKLGTPALNVLPALPGVFYQTDNGGLFPAAQSVSDSANLPKGVRQLKYMCTDNKGPNLLVWHFPKPGLVQGNLDDLSSSSVFVRKVACGGVDTISPSFKMTLETPGVYFCLGGCGGDMCSGYMSEATNPGQYFANAPFAGKTNAVVIVNDQTNNVYYGIIFHGVGTGTGAAVATKSGYGLCSQPIYKDGCNPVDASNTSYYETLQLNKISSSSGNGANFYSETFDNGGYYPVLGSAINYPWYAQTADAMKFLYINPDGTPIDEPEPYKNKYVYFSDRPGSIDIKGNYLVGLYTKSGYCQTFQGPQSVTNLKAQAIMASGTDPIYNIFIIPTE